MKIGITDYARDAGDVVFVAPDRRRHAPARSVRSSTKSVRLYAGEWHRHRRERHARRGRAMDGLRRRMDHDRGELTAQNEALSTTPLPHDDRRLTAASPAHSPAVWSATHQSNFVRAADPRSATSTTKYHVRRGRPLQEAAGPADDVVVPSARSRGAARPHRAGGPTGRARVHARKRAHRLRQHPGSRSARGLRCHAGMPTSGGPRKGTDRRQRSLNGTYVNQERIERRAAARRRVQIGKFRLVHCTDA